MNRAVHNLAIKLPLCSVIGAALTVLSSYLCAIRVPDKPSYAWNHAMVSCNIWPIDVDSDWPPTPQQYGRSASLGHSYESWLAQSDTGRWVIERTGSGWPFAAFSLDSVSGSSYVSRVGWSSFRAWDPPNWIPAHPKFGFLPNNPLARGIVFDTAFFAVLAYLISFAPGTIRRVRRRRRGLCLTCGYDLGVLSTCPECGTSPSRY